MTAMGFLVTLAVVFAVVWIYLGRRPKPRAKLGPDGPDRPDRATGDMEIAAELGAGPLVADRPGTGCEPETDWSGLHEELPLPESYAEDIVVALVRNPRSLYVYWDRSGLGEQHLRAELGEQWRQSLPVIRIYDLSAGAEPGQTGGSALTIPVGEHDDHWFINDGIEPGHRYVIGYERVTPNGAFHLLMQSAPVETPGHRPAPGTFVSEKYGWQPDQQSGSPWR